MWYLRPVRGFDWPLSAVSTSTRTFWALMSLRKRDEFRTRFGKHVMFRDTKRDFRDVPRSTWDFAWNLDYHGLSKNPACDLQWLFQDMILKTSAFLKVPAKTFTNPRQTKKAKRGGAIGLCQLGNLKPGWPIFPGPTFQWASLPTRCNWCTSWKTREGAWGWGGMQLFLLDMKIYEDMNDSYRHRYTTCEYVTESLFLQCFANLTRQAPFLRFSRQKSWIKRFCMTVTWSRMALMHT